jgi:hypothetical protein
MSARASVDASTVTVELPSAANDDRHDQSVMRAAGTRTSVTSRQMPQPRNRGPQSQPHMYWALRTNDRAPSPRPKGVARASSMPAAESSRSRPTRSADSNRTSSMFSPARSAPVTSTSCGTNMLSAVSTTTSFSRTVAIVSSPSKRSTWRAPSTSSEDTANVQRYAQSTSSTHCTARSYMRSNGSGMTPRRSRSRWTCPGTSAGCHDLRSLLGICAASSWRKVQPSRRSRSVVLICSPSRRPVVAAPRPPRKPGADLRLPRSAGEHLEVVAQTTTCRLG